MTLLTEFFAFLHQASAMQKVLSQDSQRKKREGKLQKQREEMEQVCKTFLTLNVAITNNKDFYNCSLYPEVNP